MNDFELLWVFREWLAIRKHIGQVGIITKEHVSEFLGLIADGKNRDEILFGERNERRIGQKDANEE